MEWSDEGMKARRAQADELEREHIEFKLRWIAQHADGLTEGDLDWAARMEDAFRRNLDRDRRPLLTERQQAVLERVYQKAC